jgi:hypothetical protein
MAAPAADAGKAAQPNGFEMLTRFIPAETITFYVGALGVTSSTNTSGSDLGMTIYVTFALLTPAILWILAIVERSKAGDSNLMPPLWPMLASTLAFLVWAVSAPGNPLHHQYGSYAAFVSMGLSFLLSQFDIIIKARALATNQRG